MALLDTPIEPAEANPADVNAATLFTATAASSVFVTARNGGAAPININFGITPSGGSVQWEVEEVSLPVNESMLRQGPYFLRSGDAITVQSDVANDGFFTCTGMMSS